MSGNYGRERLEAAYEVAVKVVFYNIAGIGHINPTLPLVKLWVENEAEVFYYSYPQRQALIETIGAKFFNYGYDEFSANDFNPGKNFVQQTFPATQGILPYLLQQAERERPDLIFYDSMAPWGYCVAKILGIPAICTVTTFALSREIRSRTFARFGLQKDEVNERALVHLRQEYGIALESIDALGCYAESNLVFTSQAFNPALGETSGKKFYFTGASCERNEDLTSFPLVKLAKLEKEKKVVYFSLGTILFSEDPRSIRIAQSLIEAFGHRDDCVVIISVGGADMVRNLGPLPDNVFAFAYVPQIEILKKYANIFVNHAGMNSLNEALHFSVPVLVLPHSKDQFINAERVVELGVGKSLNWEQATARNLGAAVSEILENPQYRENCRQFGFDQELKITELTKLFLGKIRGEPCARS